MQYSTSETGIPHIEKNLLTRQNYPKNIFIILTSERLPAYK